MTDVEIFTFQGYHPERLQPSPLPHEDLFTVFLCFAQPPSSPWTNRRALQQTSRSQNAPKQDPAANRLEWLASSNQPQQLNPTSPDLAMSLFLRSGLDHGGRHADTNVMCMHGAS